MVEVPTIDITALDPADRTGANDVVAAIDAAAAEFGFFQIVGHRVSNQLLDDLWQVTRALFELDRAAKLAISRTKDNSRGYYDRELTKNRRDLKEVFDFAHVPFPELGDDHPDNFAPIDGYNQWPSELPELRPTMHAYLRECERVAHVLLSAFERALGVEPHDLVQHFDQYHTSFIRLNHYPLTDPVDSGEAESITPLGDMALHHHSDAGAITILLQDDVGGLQVEHRGEWIDVPPKPDAFVVNTGDMMQVWSNDRYRAALHRVAPRSNRERFSLPYFFNPTYETDYAPLATNDMGRPRYRALNWGDFRQARADGDYADYGEEIQISQFRI